MKKENSKKKKKSKQVTIKENDNKKKSNKKKSKKRKVSKRKTKKRGNQHKRKKKTEIPSLVKEIVISVLGGLVLFNLIFFSFFSIKKMTSQGMAPTINKNDVVLSHKRPKDFKRFDVVILSGSNRNGFVRIIGLPGESIRYKDDYLYVNEQPVDEKFLIKEINEYNKEGKTFTEGELSNQVLQVANIPKDKYLVLGDNRPYATDSRFYGLVSKKSIVGRATFLLSPFKRLDNY